jgi:hypothetical protein
MKDMSSNDRRLARGFALTIVVQEHLKMSSTFCNGRSFNRWISIKQGYLSS